MKPLIPYVRQSRAKEKTISLDAQRAAITKWAKDAGVELAAAVIERGVSGSKSWRERGLGEAVAACERGEASGIIVAFQDRLSRENGIGTAEVYEALEKAGARLVAACEGLDTATGDHELLFTIKAAIAREQWKRFKKNWAAANEACAKNGVYQGLTPVGYDKIGRGLESKLVKNKDADFVRRAFELKAAGGSYKECRLILEAAGVKTATGKDGWGVTSLRSMFRNPIYKGTLANGHGHLFSAYAIVSPSTWQACQSVEKLESGAKSGRQDAGDWAVLGGLVRCAGCGKRMAPNSTRRKLAGGGENLHREYGCKRIDCDKKARANAHELESYVLEAAYDYFAQAVEVQGGAGHGRDTDSDKLTALEIEAEEARRRMAAFVAVVDPTDAGFAERVAELRATVHAAEAAVADERERTRVLVSPDEMRRAFEGADLAGKRALVREMLNGVTVTGNKSDGPLTDRTEIDYRVLIFAAA